MEIYRFYPAMSDVRSSASSTSILVDNRPILPAADSLTSMNHDVSDCCPDVTTFGDTRRMVHCLAEHVIHSE